MSTLKVLSDAVFDKNEKLEIEKENSFTQCEPHYMAENEQEEELQEGIQLPVYSPQQFSHFKRPKISFDEFNLDEDPKKKLSKQTYNQWEIWKDWLTCSNNLPAPSNVDNHFGELALRFAPSQRQDEFVSNYVKGDDLLRIKVGLCDDILNDEETLKFEDWVEQLCTSTNHESLKEMARKQKVKRYLDKKHNRTYEKKVHYHIRQKVAEERLRVKGRFVTWGQALKMLDEKDTKKSWSYNDYTKIKGLLNEKFGAVKSEKSLRF
ncbi:unnamed protein product (macronuclear) [Paramecium tetraurelia]|uniref:CCT domain-containing protein n=1 Tax=Paramecium tetraurelia TaxID=5888 RepID=A0BFD0_PARTE|nr:uncharacterized protein GSPATT00028282001 [Paramecium tetraurelia]CAK57247.1 unnamed protein product [Paramecium tetraurelia]|eukprot:XP_001424645.1 hypothetical protein (macronuclear) [Paramecium tetraurelia strain d4-2]